MPRRGAELYSAAKKATEQLYAFATCSLAFMLANIYNDVAHCGGSLGALNQCAQAAKQTYADLPREYERMLTAIVASVGCLRSKLALAPSGESFNELYKKRFIAATIAEATTYEQQTRARVDQLVNSIDQARSRCVCSSISSSTRPLRCGAESRGDASTAV